MTAPVPPPDRDPQENIEQIVSLARGPKGDAGQAGQAGQPGQAGVAGAQGAPGRSLPRAQRQAITWMFAFCVLLVVACFLGLFHYARALAGQQHVVAAQEKVLDGQQRALHRQQQELDASTAANARQRCTSLEQDVSIPITHPIAGNPSREWEARFEAIDRERVIELRCKPA